MSDNNVNSILPTEVIADTLQIIGLTSDLNKANARITELEAALAESKKNEARPFQGVSIDGVRMAALNDFDRLIVLLEKLRDENELYDDGIFLDVTETCDDLRQDISIMGHIFYDKIGMHEIMGDRTLKTLWNDEVES